MKWLYIRRRTLTAQVPWSGDVDAEVEKSKRAISILGGVIEKVDKFTLPETDIERSLVYIKKVKNTGKKYPRKAGLPSKEPLV